jgi:hypothetical protein
MNAVYGTTTDTPQRTRHGQLTRLEMLNRLESAQARETYWRQEANRIAQTRGRLFVLGLCVGCVVAPIAVELLQIAVA